MADRSWDWMEQAERDLEIARSTARDGFHEWACFAAQQAAEKALKAAHLSHLHEYHLHSIQDLLKRLNVPVAAELLEKATVLDNYYIPTRYANGHAEGAPFRHYTGLQSKDAIAYANEIVEFARAHMAESR